MAVDKSFCEIQMKDMLRIAAVVATGNRIPLSFRLSASSGSCIVVAFLPIPESFGIEISVDFNTPRSEELKVDIVNFANCGERRVYATCPDDIRKAGFCYYFNTSDARREEILDAADSATGRGQKKSIERKLLGKWKEGKCERERRKEKWWQILASTFEEEDEDEEKTRGRRNRRNLTTEAREIAKKKANKQ